jgi:hypothetical protein
MEELRLLKQPDGSYRSDPAPHDGIFKLVAKNNGEVCFFFSGTLSAGDVVTDDSFSSASKLALAVVELRAQRNNFENKVILARVVLGKILELKTASLHSTVRIELQALLKTLEAE